MDAAAVSDEAAASAAPSVAAASVAERRAGGAAGPLGPWAAAVLAAVLVIVRVRLLVVFGSRWTDEDQSLLWYAAHDLAGGHVREPYFFGQPYGSWFEALVAVPAVIAGAPFRWAVPAAASAMGSAPWLLFALLAGFRRRAWGVAVAVLAAALVVGLQGTMVATMPRGLLPGVVLGCVAAAVVLWSPVVSLRRAFLFGLLLVVSASLNVGAGLVTGPVAVWCVLSSFALVGRRLRVDVRRLAGLGGGLAVGGGLHLAAQRFYRLHPEADLHPAPAFSFSAGRLGENLGHLDRYLSAFGPTPLVLTAVALVAVSVVWRGRRSLAVAAAVVTALALAAAVLGTAKANDGAPSVFFPYARVYLGLPWMLCALLCLPTARPARRGSSALRRRRLEAFSVLVVVVVLAVVALRQVALNERVGALVAAADGVPPVVPVATDDLARRCDARRRLARESGADVVVDRYDRTATYGCGAVLEPEGVTTLFPEYERRTWLLEAAKERRVDRVLVSGFEACPPIEAADVRCTAQDDGGERLLLVEGRPRTVTTWARDLGITVRPT